MNKEDLKGGILNVLILVDTGTSCWTLISDLHEIYDMKDCQIILRYATSNKFIILDYPMVYWGKNEKGITLTRKEINDKLNEL